ncbi:zinc ribbon domain-containing protein [Arthrobacter sunyaminii]|uniref:zinc ribbon domain-containing protein n=1 Tax=Arthrobacter sunyaminii TaxID=2816859 RepID=UPI001A948314|nr:zinc ribbon domain-containing protein [Arthrobacter sunyaminii]MBO0896165.1 zinc ribbon domain-containing protein [Arthrobacter sunyaminii]
MNFCMSCGTKLQPEWQFCANCRRPVDTAGSPQAAGTATGAVSVTPVPPEAPESAARQPEAASPAAAPQTQATQPEPPQTLEAQGAAASTGATRIIETGGPGHAAPAQPGGGYGAPAGGDGHSGPPSSGGGDGGGSGPEGPADGDTPESGKKTNRKAIILGAVAVVLVAVGVGAFLFIQNMIRGGAGSPEQVAEKLIESIETKDGIGLVTMVAPAEREALDKFQEGFMDKVEEFGIFEAANKVGEDSVEDEFDDEINLDGISVTFENVEPTVTEVDDQLAVLNFSSGTVRLQIDPEQTTGAVRSGLEASGEMEPVDETADLADLDIEGEGLRVAAVKDGGRWYVSPMYSGLELVLQLTGNERGSLPEPTDGADSPAEAAQALVGAVPGILDSGKFTDLGKYLMSYEGNAVHYYGGALDEAMDGGIDSGLEITANTFKDAEKDGDRGRALVEELKMEADGDALSLTADCMESGPEKYCRGESGYVMTNGSFDDEAIMRAFPQLGLSSVKEDGKWKVSIMDTTTDLALQWMDTITREQALAMLDLARSEDAAGTMTLDEETDLEFNSAGYAVMTLKLEEDTALQGEGGGDSYSSYTVYSKDGKEEITSSDELFADETPAGEYKVVIFAGEEWADEFAAKGNDVKHSGSVTIQEQVAPSAIDGFETLQYNYLTLDEYPGPTATHVLDVPKGANVELVVTAEGYMGAWDKPGSLVLTLDGKTHKVPVTNDDEELTIPLSAGMGQELSVELVKGDGSGEEVDYTLELVTK